MNFPWHVEVKYAVTFSKQTYSNYVGTNGNVIMADYGKVKRGLASAGVTTMVNKQTQMALLSGSNQTKMKTCTLSVPIHG